VAQRRLEQIRERIRLGEYDMTAPAMEEMAEDELTIIDVESAILNGQITRTQKDDPRGTKYVIEGACTDPQTRIGAVGRFAGRARYLIITVYRTEE